MKDSAGKRGSYEWWKALGEDLLEQPCPDRGLLDVTAHAVSMKYPELKGKLEDRLKETPQMKAERI